jgi:hypothetical protein
LMGNGHAMVRKHAYRTGTYPAVAKRCSCDTNKTRHAMGSLSQGTAWLEIRAHTIRDMLPRENQTDLPGKHVSPVRPGAGAYLSMLPSSGASVPPMQVYSMLQVCASATVHPG